MGLGIGKYCECCGYQLDIELGFDLELHLCDECKNETIPMVLRYLSGEIHENAKYHNNEEDGWGD